MRRVVSTLLAAVPVVASIVGLLLLLVYVSAVMGTMLFAEASDKYFGDLGRSLWTLFQVMTGEAWPDVAADVMEEQPMAWVFFLVFILVSTFVVLNLFLAVIVSAMESVRDDEQEERQEQQETEDSAIATEIAGLRQEIAALRERLESDRLPRPRS
jgi:voltage-gated sodium channel